MWTQPNLNPKGPEFRNLDFSHRFSLSAALEGQKGRKNWEKTFFLLAKAKEEKTKGAMPSKKRATVLGRGGSEKEKVRFELTEPISSSDFKSDAIDHSAISP